MAQTEVTINWTNENNDIAETYEIHRSQTSGFTPDSSTKIDQVPPTANQFTDKVPDGTYYYKIKAIRKDKSETTGDIQLVASCGGSAPATTQYVIDKPTLSTTEDISNFPVGGIVTLSAFSTSTQ